MIQRIGLVGFAALAIGLVSAYAADDESQRARESIERRQRVELLGFFLKDPSRARLPKTPSAIEHYNQAVKYFEQKEYPLALDALDEAVRLDPRSALAYELMGDIFYLQQRMGEAKAKYLQAFELQPRAGLKEKLSKVRTETLVEKDLSTYTEKNFIIKYHGEEKDYEGFELRELLRETYRSISSHLGYYFNHKVVVLLYADEEFQKLMQLPHWAAGLYDGKIRIPAYRKGFSDRELRALVAHEMTHAFVAAISAGRAPAWINEGLAEYEENRVNPVQPLLFRGALKGNRLIPLNRMIFMNPTSDSGNAMEVGLFYEQSFSLTDYLIKRYGIFRVKQVLKAFGEGKNSDDALRSVLRISPERLEREWIESVS